MKDLETPPSLYLYVLILVVDFGYHYSESVFLLEYILYVRESTLLQSFYCPSIFWYT